MKKEKFFIFGILFLIFTFGAFAQVVSLSSLPDKSSQSENLILKSNGFLGTYLEIPDELHVLARVVFGISDSDNVDISGLIILIVLWIVLFVILKEISFSFLKDWKHIALAVIVTLIISVSRGLIFAYMSLSSFAGLIKFIGDNSVIELVFNLLLIAIVSIVAVYVIKYAKYKNKIEENNKSGRDIGLGI